MNPPVLRLGLVAVVVAACCVAGVPFARAQSVALDLKDVTLNEALSAVRAQSGYDFTVERIPDAGTRKQSLQLERAGLAEALREVGARFGCRFRPLDAATLIAEPTAASPATAATAGPYRLGIEDPGAVTGSPMALQLTVGAEKATRLAAIQGIVKLRAVDRFGRSLLAEAPTRPVGSSSRSGLGEWRAVIPVLLPGGSKPRLRLLDGTLRAYDQVDAVHLELPLAEGENGPRVVEGPVEAQLAGFYGLGDVWTAEVRLACPRERSLAGQLVVGNLAPALVDRRGRVYRTVAVEQDDQQESGGKAVRTFRWRYERVGSQPTRLAFDLYARGGKVREYPFAVRDLPLPGSGEPDPLEEFADDGGGAIVLSARGAAGPKAGTLTVGLARQSGSGWSAWRWLDVVTDEHGRAQLEGLAEGRYRVLRAWQGASPSGREPLVVEVRRGKQAVTAPLVVTVPDGGGASKP